MLELTTQLLDCNMYLQLRHGKKNWVVLHNFLFLAQERGRKLEDKDLPLTQNIYPLTDLQNEIVDELRKF